MKAKWLVVPERISKMLSAIFVRVWRRTSSSVQNVLNSPTGLPPGVLALRPCRHQTRTKIPRRLFLRCALTVFIGCGNAESTRPSAQTAREAVVRAAKLTAHQKWVLAILHLEPESYLRHLWGSHYELANSGKRVQGIRIDPRLQRATIDALLRAGKIAYSAQESISGISQVGYFAVKRLERVEVKNKS